MECDVAVIGAGAAGLLAATRAAERGQRVILLERNRKPGVKILMSGGTRCNVTHACGPRDIVAAFGPPGRFLHSAVAALGPQDVIDLVEAEGVPTKVEETGKVFPVSDKALDIQQALLRRLTRSGCRLLAGVTVQSVEQTAEQGFAGFRILTDGAPILAPKVILTTGGRSYPGCGTTGDGYRWAAALGHTIVPTRPALTPITSAAPWLPVLRGITLPDVIVRVRETSAQPHSIGTVLMECRGGFLFTHFGVSGPAVLDVSRAITSHPAPQHLELECDLTPQESAASWMQRWQTAATQSGRRPIAALLAEFLPRRLVETILDLASIPAQQTAAQLSKAERAALTGHLKSLRIPVSGTLGFEKAEVTAGGIALEEVDSRSMESRRVPGLFIAGEVLDLDGPIGGYNFQAAFSTGWLAGERV